MEKHFINLLQLLGREGLNEILFNWNESELNEDGSEILIYVDSRSYGPRTGGADIVDKGEFINWLLGTGPFDAEVYGDDIQEDTHWVSLIEKARIIVTNL